MAFRSTSLRQPTCHGIGIILTIMAMLPPCVTASTSPAVAPTPVA